MLQAFRRVAEEEMKVRAAGLPKREDLMVHKLQELCVMAVREPSWEIATIASHHQSDMKWPVLCAGGAGRGRRGAGAGQRG